VEAEQLGELCGRDAGGRLEEDGQHPLRQPLEIQLKRALAAAIDASEPAVSPAGRAVARGNDLWKGLASRGSR